MRTLIEWMNEWMNEWMFHSLMNVSLLEWIINWMFYGGSINIISWINITLYLTVPSCTKHWT